jgi:AraC-like DNA-binding protein
MAVHKGVMYSFRYPPEPSELFLDTCGYDAGGPNYRIDRTEFHGYGVEYVTRGRGVFRDDARTQVLSAGMVFCYSRLIPHSYWSDARQPLEKYWIAFKGTGAEGLLQDAFGGISGALYLREPAAVCGLFEAILRDADEAGSFTEEVCEHYLRVLLYKIRTYAVQKPGRGTGALNVLRECRAYLDANYERLTSPFPAARQNGISDTYLCHLFRRFCGLSPHQYLLSRKMSKAATFLVSTRQPVKQVAHELHFSDQYAFSRAFKRHFGVSPMQYRETESPNR